MTRFARAHGSKGSNERRPEDATPWTLLRQQMLESQQVQSARPEQLDEGAFHNEDEDEGDRQMDLKIQNIKSSVKKKKDVPKNKTYETQYVADFETPPIFQDYSSQDDVSRPLAEKKQKNKKLHNVVQLPEVNDTVVQTYQKPKKKKVQEALDLTEQYEDNDTLIHFDNEEGVPVDEPLQKKKQKKRKLEDIGDGELSVSKRHKKKKKLRKEVNRGESEIISSEHFALPLPENEGESSSRNYDTPQRDRDDSQTAAQVKGYYNVKKEPVVFFIDKHIAMMKERKRNLPPQGPFSSYLPDGRELTLVKFDGFDILKDDAERLHKLRKQLRSGGVPNQKVKEVMQLERRRAEKALQREKKKVCFRCRQPGHVMGDCPKFSDVQEGEGICFKCGSTEHRSYHCRVSRTDDFRFAKCFVCGGEGHISRQCPDNPRGLYPHGGACRVCGDVTHLKKDCPELSQIRADETLTVGRFQGSVNVEALGDGRNEFSPKTGGPKKNKIIKF